MANQRVLVFAAAAGAVVLAVAPAGAGAPADRGELQVTQRVDGAYPQGSVAYLRVRRGKRVVFKRSREGGVSARLTPRAGLYRVISYQRRCAADCGTLTAPVDACSRRVRVHPGELSRVSTVTRPGERCRMRVVEQPAFPSKRRLRAARRYVRGRGLASFALIDSHGRLHGFEPHRTYITASVVKAMLLVARLRQIGNRPPGASDRAVLDPMIQLSDNDAADVAYGWVGDAGLLDVAKRAHMSDLTVPGGHWGNVQFSAADQARLFARIDRLVPRRSRGYARHVLSSIVPYQRWGFSRYSLRHGWHTYFKGGWRTTALGSLVHEAALFERRGRRFSLAVLTDGNPSHDYGAETLRGVAARIFR